MMQPRSSTLFLLVLGALLLPGASVRAQEDITKRIDPLRDGWTTEASQVVIGNRLTTLLKGMLHGEMEVARSVLSVGARASCLTGDEAATLTVPPDFTVRRSERAEPVDRDAKAALDAWSAPLRSKDSRVKVKVVGVLVRDGGVVVTPVRVEIASVLAKGVVQQVLAWRVTWRFSAPDAEPTITELVSERFEQVGRSAFAFADQTSAVLDHSLRTSRALRQGGEYWPEWTDHIGETNLMGHQGLALGDVNGDGLEDLYVAMGNGLPNRLLLHQADGTVKDVAESFGVAWLDDTKGVLFADMDGDGDQDLLCAMGPSVVLCKNNGKGKFDEIVSARGDSEATFYHLALSDVDGDGDLDVYACRYVKQSYGVSVPLPYHDANNGPSNALFRNDDGKALVDITKEVGLDVNNRRFSLAAAWADVDGDGDQDLYVANDFGRNNLYRNDGGMFVDVASEAGVEDQAAGMGVSFGDFDGDGDLDLYVTNMWSSAGLRIAYQDRFQAGATEDARRAIQDHALGNSLFLNDGTGHFTRADARAGARMGRWGFGARFCDLNGDGFEDIVVPNGFLTGRAKDDL